MDFVISLSVHPLEKNIPPKLTYSARTGWNEPVPREVHKSHVMED